MNQTLLTAFLLGVIAKTVVVLVGALYFNGLALFVHKQTSMLTVYALLLLINRALPDKDKSN